MRSKLVLPLPFAPSTWSNSPRCSEISTPLRYLPFMLGYTGQWRHEGIAPDAQSNLQANFSFGIRGLLRRGVPVTYVTFPDEGHGFVRPENRLAFFAVVEAFLAKHLGGRYQPVGGDFAGSSLKVETGGEFVPGLAG